MINIYVSLFFRIFNTIFFSIAAVYVFKKYIKKKLVFEMDREERTTQTLLEKQYALEQDIRLLEEKIERDKVLALQLQEKVALWASLHQNDFALKEEKIKQGIAHLHSYKITGAERYAQYKNESALLETVKEKLLIQTATEYNTIVAQNKFLTSAIKHLQNKITEHHD